MFLFIGGLRTRDEAKAIGQNVAWGGPAMIVGKAIRSRVFEEMKKKN